MLQFEIKQILKKRAVWIFIMQIFVFASAFYKYPSSPLLFIGINIGTLSIQIALVFFDKFFIGCDIRDDVLHIKYVHMFKIKVKEIAIDKLTFSITTNNSLRGGSLRRLRIFSLGNPFFVIDELDLNELDMDLVVLYFKNKFSKNEVK